MKENEMVEVVDLMKRVVIDSEDPKKVQADAANLRTGFENVHFCFENATKAYEYIKIR
jgi:hypothetical protein